MMGLRASCVRLRLQAPMKSRAPGVNRKIVYFDDSVFTVFTFPSFDGPARSQPIQNPHAGAGCCHCSRARRPRCAGHGANRNRQDPQFPHSHRGNDAKSRRPRRSPYRAAHARTRHADREILPRHPYQPDANRCVGGGRNVGTGSTRPSAVARG